MAAARARACALPRSARRLLHLPAAAAPRGMGGASSEEPAEPAPLLPGRRGRAAVAEVEELPNGGAEVLEEGVRVLGIKLRILAELGILHEDEVRRQHHQLTCRVLVLLRAGPRLPLVRGLHRPRVLQQLAVVLVAHRRGGARPGPPVAGPLRVAGAEAVGAAQRDDLPVVEAHAVEDVAQVGRGLLRRPHVRAREPAVLVRLPLPHGALRAAGLVDAPRRERDARAAHLLDGDDGGVDPYVRVRGPWELLLDGLQQLLRILQARVGAPRQLGLEAHRGAAGAPRARVRAEGPRRVPSQAHEEGARGGARVGGVDVPVVLEQLHDLLADGGPIAPVPAGHRAARPAGRPHRRPGRGRG
eukprot:CAMPEP_0176224426 /NCGR_PEP_ID=MMETSP0121_2-20121125/21247_1 /TAXON_ID=160619 /ORGANISM="Kryptoperidinium foliaceum, Strain CCMP 1326" /LENGTH=357 /DNA_ID=CAMNT_0017563677 /DNA_START=47 /DNA_END=1116 /DNA_ORIENTATION=+